MRKLISMMLALLMLALPVFSVAEETAQTAPGLENLMQLNYSTKYLLQGQEVTTDLTVTPSDTLFAIAQTPEETAQELKAFFEALGFRTTAQTAEGMIQGGFAVLLGGEEAVSVTTALAEKNLYIASNLLGEKILQLTGEDLQKLADQAVQQMVEQGVVSQELVDSVKGFIARLQEDPAAAIASLFGEPDFGPLMTAAMEIFGSIKSEEITEGPEALPDAAAVIVVPLQKEALTKLTTELGKLLWSLPVVSKLASMAPNGPKSEEDMIAGLSKLPAALAEDTELKVYMAESGSMYFTIEAKVQKDDAVQDLSADMLIATNEAGADITIHASLGTTSMTETVNVAIGDGNVNVNAHMIMETEQDGTVFQPVEETITMAVAQGETEQAVSADILVSVVQEPGAAPIGVTIQATQNAADLGDHAEENTTVTFGLKDVGDLLTLNIASKTGLAEAYIVTPDALQIMAMSDEEKQALTEEVNGNAMSVLTGAMKYLPASLMTLVVGQ